jgi:hypothetical protein
MEMEKYPMKLSKYITIAVIAVTITACTTVNPIPIVTKVPTSTPTPFKLKIDKVNKQVSIEVPVIYPIVGPDGKVNGYFQNYNDNKNYMFNKDHQLIAFVIKKGDKANLYDKDPKDGGKLLGEVPVAMFNVKKASKK